MVNSYNINMYRVSEMFCDNWISQKVCIFEKNVQDKSCRIKWYI